MNIARLLEKAAIRFGDRPALSIHDRRFRLSTGDYFEQSLPKNDNGKILKAALRELLARGKPAETVGRGRGS